jgi:hypothetical protein
MCQETTHLGGFLVAKTRRKRKPPRSYELMTQRAFLRGGVGLKYDQKRQTKAYDKD